jgi:hypothetical protein
VALPAYSPNLNPDEAVWDWAREEVTANACFGTAAKAQEKMDSFFAGLAERTAEVQCRCRTILQAQADALMATTNQLFGQTSHVDFTLVSVYEQLTDLLFEFPWGKRGRHRRRKDREAETVSPPGWHSRSDRDRDNVPFGHTSHPHPKQ